MTPFVQDPDLTIWNGDALEVLRELPSESVQCCVTSPPYWCLRDYGVDGQLGLEASPAEYVAGLVAVFAELRRVLRDDGTVWLNLGDSYAGGGCGARDAERWPKQSRNDHMVVHAKSRSGLKTKDLAMVPARVAIALCEDGWYLRSDIIWSKPNPMPESVTDRPTSAHEHVFLLAKSKRYFYDADAIKEPASWFGPNGKAASGPHANQVVGRRGKNERSGNRRQAGFNERWDQAEADGSAPLTRNKRNVWEVQTVQFADGHFATFPPALIEPCILAGSKRGDTVLDPFFGSGTTGIVAKRLGRKCVGIELNPEYAAMAAERAKRWWRNPPVARSMPEAQASLLEEPAA